MKNSTYQNAVDKLMFSDDLYERVMENANVTAKPVRLVRVVAIAAAITTMLVTTALAVGTHIKEKLDDKHKYIPVQTLGTSSERFDDAKLMHFAISEDMQGVSVQYMELDFTNGVKSYRFRDGILWGHTGVEYVFYRITEDYQLESLQMLSSDVKLQKGDWVYMFPNDYYYALTERGVVSNYHDARELNEKGEILTHVYRLEAHSLQLVSDIAWPVYLNVETGQIRDALPQYVPEDFPRESVYARQYLDGLLIYLEVLDGQQAYCWITDGGSRRISFTVPEDGQLLPGKEKLYYCDDKGNHYYLDENFRLQSAAPYNTYATPSAGLLEVMTEDCKLGIYDLETGMTYVFNEIDVNRGSFSGSNGYATTTSDSGRIALIKGGVEFEPYRPIIEQIGILDVENGCLRILQIENGYKKEYCSWVDDDRMGVIYENEGRQYLCVYEFA